MEISGLIKKKTGEKVAPRDVAQKIVDALPTATGLIKEVYCSVGLLYALCRRWSPAPAL